MSLLDQSLAIGPVGLSIARWLLIVAVLFALLAGALLGARWRTGVSDTLTTALLVGLAGARLAFVIRYQAEFDGWLAMLDLRDGGFAPLGGLVAAGAYLAWRLWRVPPQRTPLAGAVLAGAIVWAGLTGSLLMVEHTTRSLPDTPMSTLAAEEVSLPDLLAERRTPMVVNLWASWCPPCRREMPVLQDAQHAHADIAFVFANQGESSAHVQRFLATQDLEALRHVWLDPGARLGTVTGAQVMPTTLFYDAAGRLVDSHVGELSRASLAPYLERLSPAP